MKTGSALLNVIDVEATCWEGDEPPPGQVNEIIEIGVAIVDLAAGERIGRDRILVRPTRSTLSEYCTELTGLTQAEVDSGVDFAEACRQLTVNHDAPTRAWTSWGEYDRRQFTRQCEETGVDYPFSTVHFNAKAVFARARGTRRQTGMAKALRVAELPLEGRHHRGDDDAWNIAALVLHVDTALGGWPTEPDDPDKTG